MDGRSAVSCPCKPYIPVKYCVRYLPIEIPMPAGSLPGPVRTGAAGPTAKQLDRVRTDMSSIYHQFR